MVAKKRVKIDPEVRRLRRIQRLVKELYWLLDTVEWKAASDDNPIRSMDVALLINIVTTATLLRAHYKFDLGDKP